MVNIGVSFDRHSPSEGPTDAVDPSINSPHNGWPWASRARGAKTFRPFVTNMCEQQMGGKILRDKGMCWGCVRWGVYALRLVMACNGVCAVSWCH